MAVLFIFFFLFSFHLSFTVSTVVAQNHKIKILVILNIRPENHIVLRRPIILEPTTTHPADLSVSSGLTSSMDDQDGSRSFDETGGYDQVNEYYDPTPAIDQDVRFANRESCANYENEYPDQFADPNHQSYVGFDLGYLSNNTFSPGAYSPELDLHTDFPNFTSSTPGHQGQYVYPVSDPELALQQVEDGLGYQPTSPWDPVAHDPTYLAPNYHPPPSTTYRTLASRATRSQADVLSRSSTHTPSNWDAVSSRSGLSASSGATTCGTCGKSFGDARLARRHQTEVHRRDSDPESQAMDMKEPSCI
uniref:C2H2-type domain-containing protein n=1 Tax=Colletotrichum fructicola (strain Nara gc5) TaxID=1213859 RepID=L2FR52_COLFN